MEKVSEQGVWFHDPLMNSRNSYFAYPTVYTYVCPTIKTVNRLLNANMDIRPLCGRLSLKICEMERQKRMWQTGLAGTMHQPPLTDNTTRIIRTVLIEPLTKELCRQTGKDIHCQSYGPEGYFRLLSDGKPFAAICLPNLGNGRAFVRFLGIGGRPCTPMKELRNTDILVSFLLKMPG